MLKKKRTEALLKAKSASNLLIVMSNWERFKANYLSIEKLGFALDISRMKYPEGFFEKMEPKVQVAFEAMAELEKGAIANPDEDRMVGHYWLRAPQLAPETEISQEIEHTLKSIKAFATEVHTGKRKGAHGNFKNLLCIGIGGSALGPQFVKQALGNPKTDALKTYFFDNTDPQGIDLILEQLRDELGQTLVVVTSKSGGTPETRNGMLEAEAFWHKSGLKFSSHAVAITGAGSKLDKHAENKGWLRRFPMWDWVGGRTSELAAVGLVPAALCGYDVDALLSGAAAMDKATRKPDVRKNPAALLSLMWYYATDGAGKKDMVILPYKDRLELFSRYLQQLVMESLGKEFDLDGKKVNQGIAVYGNKGSTDQHAYVQQLRDGVLNFFITFIEVLKDRDGDSPKVEGDFTSGDFLQGFLLGTRDALYESGRESITIVVKEVNAFTVGMLIALYERAVGFYASYVNVNAYHQPGVEAGKKAAASTLELRAKVRAYLSAHKGEHFTAEAIAKGIGEPAQSEIVFKMLEHTAAQPQSQIGRNAKTPFYDSTYFAR